MAGNKTRIEIDAKALKKLKSAKVVRDETLRAARNMTRRANASLKRRQADYPDYSYDSHQDKDGAWYATVYTRSNHAKYSNAKHNTLVRVASSGK